MGKKIKKSDILQEIENKIKTCVEYQKKDPDLTAKKRIEMLENDPCGDLTYYVNITLNKTKTESSINLSDRLKNIENKRYLPLLDELNLVFDEGCIITVYFNNDGTYNIGTIYQSSLDSMFQTLMNNYFQDSCMVTSLLPKQPASGNNYLADDMDTAKEASKTKIVYGIARFNKSNIEEMLKEKFDTEKYDLYSYNIQNFKEVSYVDMSRSTSFEQNVNQFLGGSIINSITLFGAKNKLPNYNLKKSYGIYDIGAYVVNTLEEIKRCDNAQAQKKYNKYSEGIFKDYTTAKYDTYLANGGSTNWETWADTQKQFLTFKSISSYDADFKNEALSSYSYSTNLYAYEQTADLFTNTNVECIKESWQKETDIFNKKPISEISFTNSPTYYGSNQAYALVKDKLVDPPSVIVKPYCRSKIEFNTNIKYDFSVFVPYIPYQYYSEKYDEVTLVSKPYSAFERVNGYFISINTIPIKRDIIKLDNIEYEYTNEKLDIDKDNDISFTNELNQTSGIYTIEPKSYYNKALHVMFPASSLDERVIQTTITYSIIPKKVIIPIHFIQHSYWENYEIAEKTAKKIRTEYNDNYVRVCVDTIPYDPWDKVIEKLEKLYIVWSKLPADTDGNFEFPPIEEIDENELSTLICKNCEKKLNECTCEKERLCSKCFPIDLTGALENLNIETSLFKASSYIFNTDGTPATFADIAKAIYHTVYQNEKCLLNFEFESISSKSLKISSIIYENLIFSRTYNTTNSIVSQLDYNDFTKFKKEYSTKLLSYNFEELNKVFIKELPVGLMNGIIYLPTGYDIIFDYNTTTNSLTLDNVSQLMMITLSKMLDSTNDTYKELVEKTLSLFDNNSVTDNIKKFIIYPYIPDITLLLSNASSNSSEYLESFTEDYVYKVNSFDLNLLKSSILAGVQKIPIRFSIYLKRVVKCSYPRCKDPIYENNFNDGICGLDEYFKTPLSVGLTSFNFEKELSKKYARLKMLSLQKESKELIDNTMKIKLSACNSDKNLKLIDNIKLKALDNLYNFGTEYKSLINNVPDDPLNTSEKSSIICEASKKAKLKSIMDDYNEVYTYLINSILVIKEDYYNVNEQKFASIISGLSTYSNTINNYYREITEVSPNYNMCSVKFRDYIDKNENLKTLEQGITEKENANNSNTIEQIVTQRIFNNEIYKNIKALGLSEEDTIKLSKAIANGNLAEVKAFIEENKNSSNVANKLLNTSNSIANISSITNGETSSNSLLKGVSNATKKKLNPNAIESVSLTSLTDPNKLISTVSKLASNLGLSLLDLAVNLITSGGSSINKK